MVERKTGRRMSVARQILLLQLALLALVIGVGAALAVVDERRDSDDAIRRQVSSIAQTLALSDSTAAALTSPGPDRDSATTDREDPTGHRRRFHRGDGA